MRTDQVLVWTKESRHTAALGSTNNFQDLVNYYRCPEKTSRYCGGDDRVIVSTKRKTCFTFKGHARSAALMLDTNDNQTFLMTKHFCGHNSLRAAEIVEMAPWYDWNLISVVSEPLYRSSTRSTSLQNYDKVVTVPTGHGHLIEWTTKSDDIFDKSNVWRTRRNV